MLANRPSPVSRSIRNEQVSSFERDEYMDLAKVAMLKSSAAVLFGLLFLTDAVVTAQNLSTKDELAAIEQARVNEPNKAFPLHVAGNSIHFSKRGSGRLQAVLGKDWSKRPISEEFGNRTYRSGSDL